MVHGLGLTRWTIWWLACALCLAPCTNARQAPATDQQSLQNDLPRPPQELADLQAAWQAPKGWRIVCSVTKCTDSVCPPARGDGGPCLPVAGRSVGLANVGAVSDGMLARVLAALWALALRPTWRRRWLADSSALTALLALAAFALQLGALDASGLVAARDASSATMAAMAACAGLPAVAVALMAAFCAARA